MQTKSSSCAEAEPEHVFQHRGAALEAEASEQSQQERVLRTCFIQRGARTWDLLLRAAVDCREVQFLP